MMARDLAMGTGGLWHSTTAATFDVPEAILETVRSACRMAADCNDNGTPDDCDIASGTSMDCDMDGTPDECQDPVPDCPDAGMPDAGIPDAGPTEGDGGVLDAGADAGPPEEDAGGMGFDAAATTDGGSDLLEDGSSCSAATPGAGTSLPIPAWLVLVVAGVLRLRR